MTPRWLSTRGCVLVKLLSLYRLEPSYNNMATGIRSRRLFLHVRTSLIDLLFTSFVSDTKLPSSGDFRSQWPPEPPCLHVATGDKRRMDTEERFMNIHTEVVCGSGHSRRVPRGCNCWGVWSDTKISENNSECLIGKSLIEFDMTYSLPQTELLSKLLCSFETNCFAGRAKLAIIKSCKSNRAAMAT